MFLSSESSVSAPPFASQPPSPGTAAAVSRRFLSKMREGGSGPQAHLVTGSTLAVLLQHGGFQILITPGRLLKRLMRHGYDRGEQQAVQEALTNKDKKKANELIEAKQTEAAHAALAMQTTAKFFFQKLCPEAFYGVPSPLISHLTFPHEGRTYTPPAETEIENPSIPAVFTFVGQFIDHDLTFNGLNLYDVQTNPGETPIHHKGGNTFKVVPDFASPLIDLDSMYGRSYPVNTTSDDLKDLISVDGSKVVFCGCRFRLTKLARNAYDLPRWTDANAPDLVGSAWIFDPRNDENQLILHMHLLLMRVHNKLVDLKLKSTYPTACNDWQDVAIKDLPVMTQEEQNCVEEIRKKVVYIWQSVLLNDYLPRVCERSVLQRIVTAATQSTISPVLHYKPMKDGEPDVNGILKLPHEFAIAFRFGHSMLRSGYKLNSGDPVPLFDNRSQLGKGDLRGGHPLSLSHVIDWDVFFPSDELMASKSLKIDSHVTSVVFDLPESTVPDDIKTENNLPKRNLDRSRSIELGCGEDVADCFGVTALKAHQVEPDDTKHFLYMQDVNVYQTNAKTGAKELVETEPFRGYKDTYFKTPLWYYILREAEVTENGQRLGQLGSTIVGEVIVQAIMNGEYSYAHGKALFGDQQLINGKRADGIKLRDLIDFVYEPTPLEN